MPPRIDPDLMADFFDGAEVAFHRSERIVEALITSRDFLTLEIDHFYDHENSSFAHAKSIQIIFYYFFYGAFLSNCAIAYIFARKLTDELHFPAARFYSDTLTSAENLSKYPAAVDDGPNEFLPPFSREREFAILVDDTAERSPEGRFNFANLAGFSLEDLHRDSRGCQAPEVVFLASCSNSRMLFGCPISDPC